MDNMLKGMIAAACLAVIAGAGYYFYSEYREAQAQAQIAHQEMRHQGCLVAVRKRLKDLVASCLEDGDLSPSEVDF